MAIILDCELYNYRREISLLDGSKTVLRPITSNDRNALRAFHSRLSEDTRFLRYQYLKGQLTETDLKTYCDTKLGAELALLAEAERGKYKEIVGVGHYCRLPDCNTAEVAFVVQDNEQRKGIGTQLLRHLALLAWQQDIHYFVAEVLRMNRKMLSIFTKSDPGMEHIIGGGGTCTITISVAKAIQQIPV
jgi:GNAT superfamily N-acetyltransferase